MSLLRKYYEGCKIRSKCCPQDVTYRYCFKNGFKRIRRIQKDSKGLRNGPNGPKGSELSKRDPNGPKGSKVCNGPKGYNTQPEGLKKESIGLQKGSNSAGKF